MVNTNIIKFNYFLVLKYNFAVDFEGIHIYKQSIIVEFVCYCSTLNKEFKLSDFYVYHIEIFQ